MFSLWLVKYINKYGNILNRDYLAVYSCLLSLLNLKPNHFTFLSASCSRYLQTRFVIMQVTLEESTTERVAQPLLEIVERILLQSNSPDSLQKDLFYVVIIVLMLENGFLPLNSGVEIENPIANIDLEKLHEWKSPLGVFQATFILNGYQNMPLKLIISPLGAMMLINVIIDGLNSETYSTCLPVSRYIVSPQASTVPMIFRDLKHLSFNFNNKISSAVKSRIISQCGYPSASLIGLPDDVIFNIALNLPICDIIKMRKTCKTLHSLMDNDGFWHNLYKRDFNDTTDKHKSSWMEAYTQSYIEEQNKRHHPRMAGSLHDNMDYSDLMTHVENPLWELYTIRLLPD